MFNHQTFRSLQPTCRTGVYSRLSTRGYSRIIRNHLNRFWSCPKAATMPRSRADYSGLALLPLGSWPLSETPSRAHCLMRRSILSTSPHRKASRDGSSHSLQESENQRLRSTSPQTTMNYKGHGLVIPTCYQSPEITVTVSLTMEKVRKAFSKVTQFRRAFSSPISSLGLPRESLSF